MEVIPVINCPDAACARQKLDALKTFVPLASLVHLDVTDGVFSAHRTWHDPAAWSALGSPFGLEVHLMVQDPGDVLDAWLAAGAKRCIIHAETVPAYACRALIERCAEVGATMMLSSDPDTPAADLLPYLGTFSAFQVLAVHPGAAGQAFLPYVADKITFLRAHAPDAIIEVDGGMDPRTAALAKHAGADVIVSASYIFNAKDPKEAYEELRRV
jgi:ribulose-phosphate 3-epimerase